MEKKEYSFNEVMRQWGRYCKRYTENHGDDCAGCSLELNGSCSSYAKNNAQYAEQIEKHIMTWAEQNPEPVYPTWGEWFVSRGMLPVKWDDLTSAYMNVGCVPNLIHSPIPADIAEKLNIKPKEREAR